MSGHTPGPLPVKVERTCPRCRTHAYHRGNDNGVANRIACVNCGHEWVGRIRKDEQRQGVVTVWGRIGGTPARLRLGKVQSDFLCAMERTSGFVTGWTWGSRSEHERILASLVERGAVKHDRLAGMYRMTDAGRAAIAKAQQGGSK